MSGVRTSSPGATPTASTPRSAASPRVARSATPPRVRCACASTSHGKMAHGAMPFEGRNPNRAAAAVIAALDGVWSARCSSATAPTNTSVT